MRALTWQSPGRVSVETVPDPVIQDPTDAIVRVTSTAICGSDLHLYNVLGPYIDRGDILGHEFMGIVEEVGSDVGRLSVGDRVVVPFNISCGHCWMCEHDLQSQCETTRDERRDKGAALFGYTKMYGQVAGGQAEYVRVPHADYGPEIIRSDAPDERFLYLSDILPTAWQGARWLDIQPGSTVAVIGLGPVGQLITRAARVQGAGRVIGVDMVDERLAMAAARDVEVIDVRKVNDVAEAVRGMTDGRGADGVVDAVGMEAHGSPIAAITGMVVSRLPKPVARAAMEHVGIDRLAALETAFDAVRRGGTVSITGVYGGTADPIDMMKLFDKSVTIRMGQANVRRWIPELHAMLAEGDAEFGVEDLATHRLSLEDAPLGYELFAARRDGCVKVVLDPALPRSRPDGDEPERGES